MPRGARNSAGSDVVVPAGHGGGARTRGSALRRVFAGVGEGLAGDIAPFAIQAADLREHFEVMAAAGVGPDQAPYKLIGLIATRRFAAFEFFAVAFEIGDGGGDAAFEAGLGEVDAVDGHGEFAGGGVAGRIDAAWSRRANFH